MNKYINKKISRQVPLAQLKSDIDTNEFIKWLFGRVN